MEQNTGSGNRSAHNGQLVFNKETEQFSGENMVFSIHVAGTIGYPNAKKKSYEFWSIPCTIYKN